MQSSMMISSCRVLTALFGLVLVFGLPTCQAAETEPTGVEKNAALAEAIQISADRLVSQTNDNVAEFIGNVRVRQGETRIDADRLKIFFNRGSGAKEASPEQSLEKLVALGNVKINVDNRLAVAEKAVYITKTRVLTLNGPGAKITSGDNTISGKTITFYRDEGRFTVDGGAGGRVEAVILPTESGLE